MDHVQGMQERHASCHIVGNAHLHIHGRLLTMYNQVLTQAHGIWVVKYTPHTREHIPPPARMKTLTWRDCSNSSVTKYRLCPRSHTPNMRTTDGWFMDDKM